MPPNALNSTLIAKYKVFLWVDSAQTVLTTCQSTSELKQHTLPAIVSHKSKDTWLKFQTPETSSAANFAQNITEHLRQDLTFSRHSHCKWHKKQEPLSLHLNPKPLKLKARLVDVPYLPWLHLFQGVIKTPKPHQSTQWVSESTEFSDWGGTKLPNYWSIDKKHKNCLPDKPCSQVLNFNNNSPRFKEQLISMYVWQGPWFEPRNHRVFCSPFWGVGVCWDPSGVFLQGSSWPLRSFSGTDGISVSCGHCQVIRGAKGFIPKS